MLRVGILFAASTLSRLLAGLIVVKIIAVYIGPSGLGQLGQFMSLIGIITILAGGGIGTGIVKYVAEFKHNDAELRSYISAASLVTITASLLVGAFLLLAAPSISQLFLKTQSYAAVIRVLAVMQFLIAGSNFLMGLVNGHQRVNAFAIINVASVIVGAVGMAFMSRSYGVAGAMYGLMWMPACSLFLLLPWYRFGLKFEWNRLLPAWHPEKLKRYMGYTAMLLVTALTMQMSQVAVRNIIEMREGWINVGYWQAATKISDAYLQFITVVLANYFLPKLAELKTSKEIGKAVAAAYRLALPVLLVLTLSIFLLREQLIPIVFSKAFLPMKAFIPGQLIGDFFKVGAYIVAYVGVARANAKLYIAAELLQASLMISLSYLMVGRFGAVGATYAYSLTYIIYCAVAYSVFRVFLRRY